MGEKQPFFVGSLPFLENHAIHVYRMGLLDPSDFGPQS